MAVSMMKAARARRVNQELDLQDVEAGGSPVKTVLGSLSLHNGGIKGVTNKIKHKVVNKAPDRIEDVPFRRQDRRILNARNRRLMDRKLILFIVSFGVLLISVGSLLVILYLVYQEEYQHVRPFVIIGPVLIGGGVIALMCSLEICVRLFRANKRVQDPDLDNLINPHEVKHWMDPRIIPFGWGLFREDGEVMVIEKVASDPSLGGGRSALGSITPTQLEDVIDKGIEMFVMDKKKGTISKISTKDNENLMDSPHRYGVRGDGYVRQ